MLSCIVWQVFADEASHRGVWFHATVLDVEENRIHVCYTDRFADEGILLPSSVSILSLLPSLFPFNLLWTNQPHSITWIEAELGQVKEWIVLGNEGDKPPRVRAAHPATGPKPEGIRKRRREAVGSSSWAVGDHVDAWIRDG